MELHTIEFHEMTAAQAMALSGPQDRNLRQMNEMLGCEITLRDGKAYVKGDSEAVRQAELALSSLNEIASRGQSVPLQDVIYACRLAGKGLRAEFAALSSEVVGRTLSGKAVVPKTAGQYEFVKAMNREPVVFAIGPAGTGKTYLAVIKAVSMLKKGEVRRIVLTRPAVEAGENLGFLPGDLKEKVDPYLTPLYDALHDMLGLEQTERLIEKGTIEIAPLAYMRGRTLDDSFVILDEAQNTTSAQMKMFLTRLGFHSSMVITGDVTQIDLKSGVRSGLIEASRLLRGIPGIRIVELSGDDVVRHPLVQRIIEAYSEAEERR